MGVTTRQRAMRSKKAGVDSSLAEDVAPPIRSKLAADESANAARNAVEIPKGKLKRRKSLGTTFLSGVNLACQTVDPLSFPDPPTPTRPTESSTTAAQKPVAAAEQMRRRRFSSPSPPLKDLTNNDGDTKDQEAGKRERRRTLLPPADDRHDSKHEPPNSLSRTAKRRKRKSILLPSEMSPDEKELMMSSSHMRAVSSEASGDLPGSFSGSNLKGAVVGKYKVDGGERSLVRMVREYCALPDSARFESDQSRHIEALSGYSIVPSYERMQQAPKEMNASPNGMSVIPSNNEGSSDSKPISLNDFRRTLLFKMGPVVDLMERSKKEETKVIEKGTRCRVEKQERRQDGICPYRYRDTLTGKEVPKEEYEARYMGAIESRKKARAGTALGGDATERISERFGRGGKAHPSPSINACRSSPSPSFNDSSELRNDSPKKNCSTSVKSRCSGQDVDDAYGKSKTSCSPTSHSGSDMSECLSPLSFDHSPDDLSMEEEKSSTENAAALVDGKKIKSKTSRSEKDASCPHSKMSDYAKTCCTTVGSSSSTSTSSERLPFPSREANSPDPAVALAQRKLWAAIDAALATYSEEILAIERQRKGEHASRQHKQG